MVTAEWFATHAIHANVSYRDPSDVHRAWQVECAIPLKTLKYDFLRSQNYTKPAVRLPTD